MNIFDVFKKKKIYIVPYVHTPDATDVYALFLIGRSRKDILHKIETIAKKYNIELYILTDAIEPVTYTTRDYGDGEILRFDYNNKHDNDYCKHFLVEPNSQSLEPFFIFPYLEEYEGSCGFKSKSLDCLYEIYQGYFAERNLFTEAAICRDAVIKLREDVTVTRDA